MGDLVTTRMKLKEAYPDLADDYGDEAEFIRKGLVPADLKIEEGERAIVSYITTAAVDRDGEIVLPAGADLKHYRKNPVVLFGHDYHSLPIGKNLWIKSDDKGLIAKTQYANHDEAEKIYQYRKDGFPLAESIGFVPMEYCYRRYDYRADKYYWKAEDLEMLKEHGLTESKLKNVRCVYTKWTMLEYSDVAVPANPEAVEIAKSKGLNVDTGTKGTEKADATMPLNSDINEPEPKRASDDEINLKSIAASIKSLTDAVAALITSKALENPEVKTGQDFEEPEELVSFDFLTEEKSFEDITEEEVSALVQEVLANHKSQSLEAIKTAVSDELLRFKGKVFTDNK